MWFDVRWIFNGFPWMLNWFYLMLLENMKIQVLKCQLAPDMKHSRIIYYIMTATARPQYIILCNITFNNIIRPRPQYITYYRLCITTSAKKTRSHGRLRNRTCAWFSWPTIRPPDCGDPCNAIIINWQPSPASPSASLSCLPGPSIFTHVKLQPRPWRHHARWLRIAEPRGAASWAVLDQSWLFTAGWPLASCSSACVAMQILRNRGSIQKLMCHEWTGNIYIYIHIYMIYNTSI